MIDKSSAASAPREEPDGDGKDMGGRTRSSGHTSRPGEESAREAEGAYVPGRVNSALVGVTGADRRDLRDSPSDVARLAIYGMTVVVTAVLATFTMPTAILLAIGTVSLGAVALAIPIGLIWGTFVFNVDRWVVSALDHKSMNADLSVTKSQRAAAAVRLLALFLVRLAIAGLIGLSISEPILLLIFRHEVTAQIQATHNQEIHAIHDRVQRDWAAPQDKKSTNKYTQALAVYLTSYNDAVQEETTAQSAAKQAADDWQVAQTALTCEEYPTTAIGCGDLPRSNQEGCVGQVCQTRQTAVNMMEDLSKRANQRLLDARATVDRARRAVLLKEGLDTPTPKDHFTDKTIPELASADEAAQIMGLPNSNGFSVQEDALARLASRDTSTEITVWVVRALFLCIDLAPLLLRYASPSTSYEHLARLRAVRRVAKAEAAFRAGVRVDAAITQAEADAESERVNRRLLTQLAAEERRAAASEDVDALAWSLKGQLDQERARRESDIAMRRIIADHARRVIELGQVHGIPDAGFIDSAVRVPLQADEPSAATADISGSSYLRWV